MCIKFGFLGFFFFYFRFFGVFLSFFESSLLILFCRIVLRICSISLHFFHQGMLINFASLGFFFLCFRFFGSFFVVSESSLLIFLCRIVLQLSSSSLIVFHQGMHIDFALFGVFSFYFRFFWFFLASLLVFWTVLCSFFFGRTLL